MAPEKAPAFQFYPRDFLSDGRVAGMSLEERGAYITLLCLCWLEHKLPAEPEKLARMVGVPLPAFRKLWAAIHPCFTEVPGGLVQKRLEKERQKQKEYRQRMADRGVAGAAARWGDA
jgi:uncharacterized protein YdaU (DUF1376 family)